MLQRPARFTIYACDRRRRHLRTGGDAFTVSIRGPSLVWPTISDHEDGSYEVEWQATVSGVYLVTCMLDGEHIADSPWPARVIAPGADPNQCRLRAGTSPVYATAGEPACFDVEFFDALGNGVAMEAAELEAVLRAAEATASPVKRKGGGSKSPSGDEPPSSGSVQLAIMAQETATEYLGRKKCRASVTIDKAGEYKVRTQACGMRTMPTVGVRRTLLIYGGANPQTNPYTSSAAQCAHAASSRAPPGLAHSSLHLARGALCPALPCPRHHLRVPHARRPAAYLYS